MSYKATYHVSLSSVDTLKVVESWYALHSNLCKSKVVHQLRASIVSGHGVLSKADYLLFLEFQNTYSVITSGSSIII